ncbi:MAG TPA: hypothetical protein VHV10_16690 [Ktedonobacteraceae bacterium]|jgi:DNA-binding CsgD family transcriptional regulator|nr:hypothetical protein [Ktedonobacteraceae bacterium]
MAVNIPFSDERYMQLLAQGYSDTECAMRMHVKESILVSEYLPVILRKAEVSTREEAVTYARYKGYGVEQEQKGVPPKEIISALKGIKMVQARAFYRALEQHFFQNDCLGCTSYFQYAVLLIKGQFYQHLGLFLTAEDQNVVELVSHLEKAGMIHIHKHVDDELYRVTFMHLQSKEEGHNDGDSNI